MHQLGVKQVIITLNQSSADSADTLTRQIPNLSYRSNQLTYTYDPRETDTGVDELIHAIHKAGLSVQDIKTTQSSLEDIFIDLVKKKHE